jgi:lysophospholipase L1-like esterase
MANCFRRTARSLRRLGALTCAAALALPALATASDATFDPPQRFYLALGDSVAYGFQFSKLAQGLPPSGYDTGYVDVFAARLRGIRPGVTVVNFSCPGESTATFLGHGRCPWTADGRALHDSYTGAQRDAAVALLRAHRGQVSPITLTLWGNDVGALVNGCDRDLACVAAASPAWLDRTRANLEEILADLRSAAPDAEIIVTSAWDSFIDAFSFADPLFQTLNGTIADVAAVHRARYADLFTVFNPQGDSAAERQAICTLTLLCGPDRDSHPSDLGYRAIADRVFDTSGYARLEQP